MYKIKQLSLVILKYGVLILATIASILPIMVVFLASFKTSNEYINSSPLSLPKNFFFFDNYVKAFVDGNMIRGFVNTVIVLVFSLIGAILVGTMTSYILSRFQFVGRKVIMAAFLFATLIPAVSTQVATFQIINFFGLFNTRSALIILNIGTDIIAVYIFMQFIEGISVSLDESAMLDGASYFTIYRRIILPLLKPAIVTVLITKGVGIYNDFYTPFLYTPKTELQVISTALFKFKGPYGTQWEVISAGIIIAIIPTLITFLSLQKFIYNGFTSGSVK